jgi:hypothetical protein
MGRIRRADSTARDRKKERGGPNARVRGINRAIRAGQTVTFYDESVRRVQIRMGAIEARTARTIVRDGRTQALWIGVRTLDEICVQCPIAQEEKKDP